MTDSPSQRATEVEARAILAEWTPELEAERLKLCLNVVERADAYGGSAARLYHEAEMALTLLGDIVSRAQAAITALDAHREAQPRELNAGQTLRTWALAKFGDRPNGAALYSLFHTYGEEIAQVVLDAHRAGGVGVDLEELERLLAAATPGPWYASDWSQDAGADAFTVEARSVEILGPGQQGIWPDRVRKHRIAETCDGERPLEDAALIATAITVLPALIAELRLLRAARASTPDGGGAT